MKKGKLLKLAHHLYNNVPRENFFQGAWKRICGEATCGFQACSAGHAALLFKGEGLSLKYNRSDRDYEVEYQPTNGGPVYTNFDAAAKFFGLTLAEAEDLFSSADFIDTTDPKEAALNIYNFVAERS